MSEIEKYEERNYAEFNIRIPPTNAGSFNLSALAANDSTAQFGLSEVQSIYNVVSDVLTGPLPAPSFDTFVGLGTLISSNLGEKVTLYSNALNVESLIEFGFRIVFWAICCRFECVPGDCRRF